MPHSIRRSSPVARRGKPVFWPPGSSCNTAGAVGSGAPLARLLHRRPCGTRGVDAPDAGRAPIPDLLSTAAAVRAATLTPRQRAVVTTVRVTVRE